MLKYCKRYYDRQFITRGYSQGGCLAKFERYLQTYYDSEDELDGIPSVQMCGQALQKSPQYLSDLLKAEMGKSAKEHIDLFLVNKAKSLLMQSNQSIKEIAYQLGFDYPNHFSKLFKIKTGFSPSDYRNYN